MKRSARSWRDVRPPTDDAIMLRLVLAVIAILSILGASTSFS